MPASRISSTDCQRFSWRVPGTLVCASSSTSTECGTPRDHRVGVELRRTSRRDTRSSWSATRSSPSISAIVSGRRCGSTKPMTTSSPREHATLRLREHRVGLTDARRVAEEDLVAPAL